MRYLSVVFLAVIAHAAIAADPKPIPLKRFQVTLQKLASKHRPVGTDFEKRASLDDLKHAFSELSGTRITWTDRIKSVTWKDGFAYIAVHERSQRTKPLTLRLAKSRPYHLIMPMTSTQAGSLARRPSTIAVTATVSTNTWQPIRKRPPEQIVAFTVTHPLRSAFCSFTSRDYTLAIRGHAPYVIAPPKQP